VPPRDTAELADAIAALLADRAEHQRLVAAARQTAAEHFSWETCGEMTLQAYREALCYVPPLAAQ
jgi:glycosyltransferase involved in cell wall biosynthesis